MKKSYSMLKFHKILIFRIFILLVFLNCKSPFATREAEEPINSRSNREIPSGPEAVLRNLQSAIQEKNVIDYLYCLTAKAEKFTFIPDEFVRQNNPTAFVAWGLNAEKNHISWLSSSVPRDSLSRLFLEDITSDVFADSAIMQRKYTLVLGHTSKGNLPREMRGQAIFWIFKEEGYWFIHKWVDIGNPEFPNWSILKAGTGR